MIGLSRRQIAPAALGLALSLAAVATNAPAQERRRVLDRFSLGTSFLGIEMEEVTADNLATYKLNAERGVIVRSVQKGSPAAEATLQEKDVILEFEGTPVLSVMQLTRLVQETPAGRRVNLTVSRDGKKVVLSAKIGKRDGPVLLRSDSRRQDPELDRMFRFGAPGDRDSDRTFPFEGPEGGNIFRFQVPDGAGPRVFSMPRAERATLGVTLEALTEQMGEYLGVPKKRGVLITAVSEGSPAAAAKLRAGDVVIGADDRSVDEPSDLSRAVERRAGDKLQLTVIRDKKEISIAVELPKTDAKKSTSTYRL